MKTILALLIAYLVFASSALLAQDVLTDQDIITTLQTLIDNEIAANPAIPGQLLSVIAPDVGLDADFAAGVVDFESGIALEPGARFRIASVTKTFTAAAVLRLVEQGQVDLDASIEQYVSAESIALLQGDGFATDRITVRHLLLHTSGIPDFSDTPAYSAASFEEPERVWTQREQIAFAMEIADPVGEPGEQYSYSDTGYILLGELIERQTGQSLGAAVRTQLNYERLGLNSTYWEVQETARGETALAHQYFGEFDMTVMLSPTIDLFGGGGMVSTTRDLVLFFRALLRGEVFEQPETLDTMLTIPQSNIDLPGGEDGAMGIFRLSGEELNCWFHPGFWGVLAMYCPDLDVAIARSINQAENTTLSSVLNPILTYVSENSPVR